MLLLLSAVARAQGDPYARHFDLVPTKATPSGNSGVTLEGAAGSETRSLSLSLLFDYDASILALVLGDQKIGDVVTYRVDAHLMATYQIHRLLDFSVDIPAALKQGDNFKLLQDYGIVQPGVSGGMGDIRLVPRAILLHPDDFPIGLALIPELRLPTGSGQDFLGDSGVVFAPRLAAERGVGPVRLLFDVGARFRRQAQFLNIVVGNELTAGLGGILQLPDLGPLRQPNAVVEMNLATPASAPFTFDQAYLYKTVWDVLVGLRGKFSPHWGAQLALARGIALHPGYGREAFRFLAAIRYEFEPLGQARSELWADSDGDGIPDPQDACPAQPGLPEFDGCPDRDGDQVPDNVDKCPDKPGPAENDGCPYDQPPFVILEADRIRIRGSILFDTGQAKIQKQSMPLLDELAELLKKEGKVGPVQVEGHTDNHGGRPFNLELSQRRANAVLQYLVNKGIDGQRLRSQGFGYDRPIATNDTALGRARNRRVEFTLIKAEPSAAR